MPQTARAHYSAAASAGAPSSLGSRTARAGTTVETAIRVLRRFEKAHWIEGGVGWVRILDRPALENIARGGEDSEI